MTKCWPMQLEDVLACQSSKRWNLKDQGASKRQRPFSAVLSPSHDCLATTMPGF
jgi:hypothetical protein